MDLDCMRPRPSVESIYQGKPEKYMAPIDLIMKDLDCFHVHICPEDVEPSLPDELVKKQRLMFHLFDTIVGRVVLRSTLPAEQKAFLFPFMEKLLPLYLMTQVLDMEVVELPFSWTWVPFWGKYQVLSRVHWHPGAPSVTERMSPKDLSLCKTPGKFAIDRELE